MIFSSFAADIISVVIANGIFLLLIKMVSALLNEGDKKIEKKNCNSNHSPDLIFGTDHTRRNNKSPKRSCKKFS